MRQSRQILLGLLAAFAFGGFATASHAAPKQTFTKHLEREVNVPANTGVRVENMVGYTRISQGGSSLKVSASVVAGGDDMAAARALADTIKLDVKQEAGQVVVHVDYPVDKHDTYQYIPGKPGQTSNRGFKVLGMHFNVGHSSLSFDYQGERVRVYQGDDDGVPLHVDLQIQLPANVQAEVVNKVGKLQASHLANDLKLSSASGDMDADGITGKLATHSGSGDMHIADVNGAVEVHTGSGDVGLKNLQGSADVHTGSGDITGTQLKGTSFGLHTGSGDIILKDLQGDLDVDTGSGDAMLRELTGVKRANVSCGSGDIGLNGDLSAMQDFTLRSGSGDITLHTSNPPAVRLDIQGSDIDVDWSGVRNVQSGRRYYRADVGAATGQGRISSGSGDVTLR